MRDTDTIQDSLGYVDQLGKLAKMGLISVQFMDMHSQTALCAASGQ